MLDNLPKHIFEPHAAPAETEGNLSDLVRHAFESPLDYPPVDQWLFPGDDVAIVLQTTLIRPVETLEAALDYFVQVKIDLHDVTVVIAPSMARAFGIAAEQLVQSEAEIANGEPPEILFVTVGKHKIGCQVHDSSNTYGLAYLAANEAGDPVHVNRLLVDADVVIPIGCPTSGNAAEVHDCIYPDFASIGRQEQFRSGVGSLAERALEIELANDNLGSFFLTQFVSAPGGKISHAIGGKRKEVIGMGTELANEQWAITAVSDVELVIATVEESGRTQTWDDFTSALTLASQFGDDAGPIVLWTSIDTPPDRNTRKALQTQFEESVAKKLSRKQRQIASVVAERQVFLRSKLPQSIVEELGIGYIQDEEDAVRIAEKTSSGILLRDAHKASLRQTEPARNV